MRFKDLGDCSFCHGSGGGPDPETRCPRCAHGRVLVRDYEAEAEEAEYRDDRERDESGWRGVGTQRATASPRVSPAADFVVAAFKAGVEVRS